MVDYSTQRFIYAGLDIEVDRILEIACIITDGNLTKQVEVFIYFLFYVLDLE